MCFSLSMSIMTVSVKRIVIKRLEFFISFNDPWIYDLIVAFIGRGQIALNEIHGEFTPFFIAKDNKFLDPLSKLLGS